MAVTTQTVVLEFDAKTGEVLKATKQVEDSMEGVADAAKDAADATEDIGKSAKTSSSGLSKMGKTGASAFKSLGTAIKATGLGLIVGLVAQLIVKFAENKKVADTLSVALAGLGAVFNTIIDGATWIIDNMVSAFQNPQDAVDGFKDRLTAVGDYMKTLLDTALNPVQRGLLNMKRGFLEAAAGAKEFFGGDATELKKQIREVDDELSDLVAQQEQNKDALSEPFVEAAEAVAKYVEKTTEAVRESTALERQMVKLRDAQRDVDIAFAEGLAQLEQLKKTRDDERLSIQDRIAAAQEAAAMEKQFTDERVRIAQETVSLLEQEIALQGATEERLQAVADARIAAADAQAASAAVQTELMTSTYALEQELITQEQEVAAMRREFRAENLEGYEAERQAAEDQLTDRKAAIELLKVDEETKTQLILEAEASRNEQLRAIDEAHKAEMSEAEKEAAEQRQAQRQKEREQEKALLDAKFSMTMGALGALQALNQAFSKNDDANAEKAFKRNKAISLATATLNTGQAVVNALTAGGNPLKLATGAQFVEAGIAAATGAAQIATISRTQYEAPAPPDTSVEQPPAPTTSGAAQSVTGAPQLDLSFLGAGQSQTAPIEAYVLAQDVSTAQQANQQIQEQASL